MKLFPKFWLASALLLSLCSATFFFMAAGPESFAELGHIKQPVHPTPAAPVQSNLNLSHSKTAATALESPSPLAPIQPASSIPPSAPKEVILSAIEEASVSYSAEELPKIQPYLLHPDPEVRAAAIQGMITVGDASAAPLLRAAAQLAISSEEASAMRDAAAYVELPSGTMLK